MSDPNCVNIQRQPKLPRDWAAIRGEISIYLLVACVIALALIGADLTSAIREDIAEKRRLNQRLNADARLIQLAIETADPDRQPWKPEDNPHTPAVPAISSSPSE